MPVDSKGDAEAEAEVEAQQAERERDFVFRQVTPVERDSYLGNL